MPLLSCIRKSLATLVLAAGFLPLGLQAASDNAPAQLKGRWVVGMIQGEKGAFAYCLARAPYNNGLQLAIALSGKREVNIGVVVPEAGFSGGDKYPMAVSIDGNFKREHIGVAPQPELIMVPLGSDSSVMGALKKGKVLSIEGPEDIAAFSLKGSDKALGSLQQCVDIGTGKIKPPKSEQMATGKGKASPFPPSLLKLLKAAGLKSLEIIPVPDPEHAPVDFAWRTEGVLGGLRERPVPEDVTLEKMSSLIEDSYKKQCKGMFTADFTPPEELPGVHLRTANISCQMEGKYASIALLLYLTDTHLFSLFMHETEGGQKEKAFHARDAIAAQIRKLAKQQKPSAAPAAAPVAAAPSAPPAEAAAPATPAPAPAASAPPSAPASGK